VVGSERYKIVGVLGTGGMGTVYLAEDRRLPGKKWAIKEIRRDAAGAGSLGEAAALVRLSHPGLPQIADYFESEDGLRGYLVMEHIEGETMEERFVRCGRKVDAATAVRWAVQLCDVLAYLHGQKPHPVIHRDLKPSNVIITGQERVVLIDFGISRLERGEGQDTVRMGTIGFAAPELLSRGRTDPRSDLYSLGAVLYYLLSGGRHPALSAGAAGGDLGDVPFPLRQVVERLLEPSPEHRFADAADVKAALVPLLEGGLRTPADGNPAIPDGAGRKRVLVFLSLYPGAGSTACGLAATALLGRFGIRHAYLEHPAAEPVLDNWLDPRIAEEPDGQAAWLTAGRLAERYGEWNDAVQLQALLEAPAQVVTVDLSHRWDADGAERLMQLADETVIVAGPRRMALESRSVRERLRRAAHWIEAGRPVTLFWNGTDRRPDPRILALPFRDIVRLPRCPALEEWEAGGNPYGLPDDPAAKPWIERIEGWLADRLGRWRIPFRTGRTRRKTFISWKKGIDNQLAKRV